MGSLSKEAVVLTTHALFPCGVTSHLEAPSQITLKMAGCLAKVPPEITQVVSLSSHWVFLHSCNSGASQLDYDSTGVRECIPTEMNRNPTESECIIDNLR